MMKEKIRTRWILGFLNTFILSLIIIIMLLEKERRQGSWN